MANCCFSSRVTAPRTFIPFILNGDIHGTANPQEAPWAATAQIQVLEIFRLSLTKPRSQPGTGLVAGAEFRKGKSWLGKCSWAGLCPQGVTQGGITVLAEDALNAPAPFVMIFLLSRIIFPPSWPPTFLEDVCVSHCILCPISAFPLPSFSHFANIQSAFSFPFLIFKTSVARNSLTGQIDQREKC